MKEKEINRLHKDQEKWKMWIEILLKGSYPTISSWKLRTLTYVQKALLDFVAVAFAEVYYVMMFCVTAFVKKLL
jgi:fluoride ion exporter CrcB/FEX